MKKKFFLNKYLRLTIILLTAPFLMTADIVTIKGKYTGKDLRIQNPFASDGNGFCINSIDINGQKLSDDLLYNNLIELPFSKYKIKVGDFVLLKIDYKKVCEPAILNPTVLTDISASSFLILKDVFGKSNQGIAFVSGMLIDFESGNKISDAQVSILGLNGSTYCYVRPKKDGSYLLAFPYTYQCVLEVEKDGYHKKRFLIDLRGIPVEKMSQQEFTVSINIEKFKGQLYDSLLLQFPSAKLEYNFAAEKVDWDEQYGKVVHSAETQILETLKKVKQLDKEKDFRRLLYLGLIFVLIFLIFLYNRFRIISKQKATIEKQKIEVDSAYHLLDEKNKEVMDSIRYAERIQKALLPTINYIDKQLDKLTRK